MITIKEFAKLCACNTQTLRYYDRIGLLKPVEVDSWSGYRYYSATQAVDFVKIKNLQAADFTIEEIKELLSKPDGQVYEAFALKIAQQKEKLERILKIQKSYLTEKNAMEKIIFSMTDYLLSQCTRPDALTEFGISPAKAPEILELLRSYLNRNICADTRDKELTMTVNDEVVHGYDAILQRVNSLTKDNLQDTILLNDESGHKTETDADGDPFFEGYEVIWERQGFEHIYDFIDEIPALELGRQYRIWIRKRDSAYTDDLSFSLFLIGAILYKKQIDCVSLSCSVSIDPAKEAYFALLRDKNI